MGRVETNFKQTEIGLVPLDWEVKPIGDCCKIYGRIGFRGYTVNDIVEEGFGSITISPSNIFDGKVNFDKCTYLSWFKYEESPEIKIFNGDILLVKTGSTFGKTAIVKGLKDKATINPQIVVLKQVIINRNLLGYIMGFRNVQNYINAAIVGGAIPTLSQKQVSSFKILLPSSKDEQTAIANALSDADGYIESLEKLIAKKQKIKQGAMQQLLKPKPHWEVKKLGEIAEVLDNLRVPLNDNQRLKMKGDIPYCGANGIVGYVDDYVIDDDIILMAEDGGYFDEYKTRPIAYRMFGKVWVNNHAHILKAKISIDQGYLFYSLVHKNILDFINGGTRAKLNKGDLINIEISLPESKTEQEEIAKTISDIDSEITTLTKKLTKAKALKQGMMQQLLTGKIRLV